MTRWGKLGLLLCACAVTLSLASQADAALMTFDVTPAFAPKGPESPNWSNYVLNAIAGVQSKTNIGNRDTSAAAYEVIDRRIRPEEIIYTPFHSWRATADPNPEFTVPFLGEFGNRFHFGLHIVGSSDRQFALSDIDWRLESDDVGGYFNQSGSLAGAAYSATRVGIDWGPDGVRGGGDDVILSGGQPGTDLVNEFIYVGIGDGFYSSEPTALTDQDDINITLADIYDGCADPKGCLVEVTATYSLPGEDGGRRIDSSGSFIIEIPEPSSAILVIIGLVGLGGVRRHWR
ncbi:MAG: PEP-CTERM sorting domain-containing protein [Planctomycetaceae bacterium]|nr:PEP-CTERM sorting domain-containing protein [Planctomycetaceae bacterium]